MTYETAKEQAEENELKKEQMQVKTTRRRLNEKEEESEKEVVKRQMMRSARILERMVNQNNHNDISLGNFDFNNFTLDGPFSDFRFYDDAADEFKENEGTLLPLWKFTFEKAGKLENTALCWNPAYSDLFAASFGSCEFLSPFHL